MEIDSRLAVEISITEVKDLDRRVEVEHADLLTAEARALKRQEEPNKLKEAKKYDEQTIFTLKDSLQAFEGFTIQSICGFRSPGRFLLRTKRLAY